MESRSEKGGRLIRHTRSELGDFAELVRTELQHTGRELRENAHDARRAGTLMAVAAVAAVVGAELVLGAIVVAWRKHPIVLGTMGCALLGAGAGLASEARRSMPPLLERTRRRVTQDARTSEENAL